MFYCFKILLFQVWVAILVVSKIGTKRKHVDVVVYAPCNQLRGNIRLDPDEIILATYMAVLRIKREGLLDPKIFKFDFQTVKLFDTECDHAKVLGELTKHAASKKILPFAVGLMCDSVCYTVSKFYASIDPDIPLISIGCYTLDIGAPFPQIPNVYRIGGSAKEVIDMLFSFLVKIKSWSKVSIISTDDPENFGRARLIQAVFKDYFRDSGKDISSTIIPDCETDNKDHSNPFEPVTQKRDTYVAASDYFKDVSNKINVYMIVASECVVLNAMKAAFDLGLLKDGKIQYVFITFFFYLVNVKIFGFEDIYASSAFDGLLSINLKKPYKLTWSEYEASLRQFRDVYNRQYNQLKRELVLKQDIDINGALLFDSIYLLAKAINRSTANHGPTWNYKKLTKSLYEITDESPSEFRQRHLKFFHQIDKTMYLLNEHVPSAESIKAGYYFNFASGYFNTVHVHEPWIKEIHRSEMPIRDVNLVIEIAQNGRMRMMYEGSDKYADQFFREGLDMEEDEFMPESSTESNTSFHNNSRLKRDLDSFDFDYEEADHVKSVDIEDLELLTGVFWWPGKKASPPDGSSICLDLMKGSDCHVEESRFPRIWDYDNVLTFLLLATFVYTFVMTIKNSLQDMSSEIWSKNEGFRIRWDEIMNQERESFDGFNVLLQESRRQAKIATTVQFTDKDFYTEVGIYKAQVCSILRINSHVERINYKNPVFVEEIKQMANIRHQNLNLFLGVCLDLPNNCLVYLYNKFGSLADVIKEKILVSPSFDNKLSLILDISAGMEYLHRTALKFHGHLTSKNCVIDNRWTCKVTDYGIHLLHAEKVAMVHKSSEDALYLAPELLRIEEGLLDSVYGTKEGDLFAFGIIMQEVTLWDQSYALERQNQPLSQILRRVMAYGLQPPFRPQVPSNQAPSSWMEIMAGCLEERPEDRMTFANINLEMKKLSKGRTLHIMDVTLEKLEKLNQRLQTLVAKRTEELKQKKAEVEAWIFNILPQDIAVAMLNNETVSPEEFEEATIYFSDIVGFHVILQSDSPAIVINFLNEVFKQFDLVTNRYDLYKCETTKDIYMVVSGVPKRLKRHASEVATMALEMFGTIHKFKVPGTKNNILQLRVGLHSGPLVAGVLGTTLPQYCMYGDTVNVASRMQTSGYALKIHVSHSTASLLVKDGSFELEERGEIPIKGKGNMRTYWLKSKKGTNLSVPDPKLAAPPELHKFK